MRVVGLPRDDPGYRSAHPGCACCRYAFYVVPANERRDPYSAAVIAGKDKATTTSHKTAASGSQDDVEISDFNFKEVTHVRDLAAHLCPRFAR
jgi:hypothetical protein